MKKSRYLPITMRELKKEAIEMEKKYGFTLDRLAWSTGKQIAGRNQRWRPSNEFLKWLNLVLEEDGKILDELASR